jgi:xanthine dehydrogenase YagS FAD-binding subunit
MSTTIYLFTRLLGSQQQHCRYPAGLEMSGGAIQSAGLALGGVAPKPLRLFDVEAFLTGAEPRTEVVRQTAEIALRRARPLKQNSFKLDLAKHSVVPALTLAAKGTPKL